MFALEGVKLQNNTVCLTLELWHYYILLAAPLRLHIIVRRVLCVSLR